MPAYTKNFDVMQYAETNIIGGLRVLEYARRYRADRVLYTQSWSDLAGYWDKEKVLRPYMPKKFSYTGDHAFYAIAKNTIVESMEFYKQEFGLKNFVFRLPNVYLYNSNIFYYVYTCTGVSYRKKQPFLTACFWLYS